MPLPDARNLYLARTYAYVAGGKQGLAIIDIEKPEQPKLDQVFNAGGKLSDTRDVKVGMTSASVFAYVADGKNGFQVVQLISPETVPGHYGFSPRPNPQLIASYHTHGPALAVSEGTDRDRAVDENGNQLAVFGRRGARPFNRAEAERLSTCATASPTPSATLPLPRGMPARRTTSWGFEPFAPGLWRLVSLKFLLDSAQNGIQYSVQVTSVYVHEKEINDD